MGMCHDTVWRKDHIFWMQIGQVKKKVASARSDLNYLFAFDLSGRIEKNVIRAVGFVFCEFIMNHFIMLCHPREGGNPLSIGDPRLRGDDNL